MNKKQFDWQNGGFIIGYHLLLLATLPVYLIFFTAPLGLWIVTFVLAAINGISITAGYHRYFSHTTYSTNRFVEAVMLFFASMATQGSALRWSFDHRLHHAFVDTKQDPYTVNDGFWHAHILWLFKKGRPIDTKVVADLAKSPLIMSQHNYYPLWMVASNLVPVLLCGWLFGDFLGAFAIVWLLRLFLTHHATWCINSLAHYWGQRTFCRELSAVDNYMISLITFGEGYHNYHHKFAKDYRNGIRWYHFDPTKWLIWTLSKLGLASNLRRTNQQLIEETLIAEHKSLLLEQLGQLNDERKASLKDRVIHLADEISNRIQQLKALKKSPPDAVKEIDLQQQHLKQLWKAWNTLARAIGRVAPPLPSGS